jgi:hypothetical protein
MSILRLLTVYNEKDIIRENIEYYINQGIESIVLDNYSKDGSYEILKEYEGKGIRWIERYRTDFFDIVKLNTILLNLAFKEKEDYFIWIDDEILGFFDTRFPLKDTILKLFNYFNNDCFSVSKLEFYHTEKEKLDKENVSFADFKYFAFTRNWKNVIFKKDSRIRTYVDRPYYCDEQLNELPHKVINDLFYLKHYPFRTLRQAKRKVYRGAKGIRSENDFNTHYLYFKEDLENRIIKNRDDLIEFKDYPIFFIDLMVEKFPELSGAYMKIYNEVLNDVSEK